MKKYRSLILIITVILVMTFGTLAPASAETITEFWQIFGQSENNIEANNNNYYQYEFSKMIFSKSDNLEIFLAKSGGSILETSFWDINDSFIINNFFFETANQDFRRSSYYDVEIKNEQLILTKQSNKPYVFNVFKNENFNKETFKNNLNEVSKNSNTDILITIHTDNLIINGEKIIVIQMLIPPQKFWELNQQFYTDNEPKPENPTPNPEPENPIPDKPLNPIEKIIVVIALLPFIVVMIAIFLSVSGLTIFVSKKIKNKKQKKEQKK